MNSNYRYRIVLPEELASSTETDLSNVGRESPVADTDSPLNGLGAAVLGTDRGRSPRDQVSQVQALLLPAFAMRAGAQYAEYMAQIKSEGKELGP